MTRWWLGALALALSVACAVAGDEGKSDAGPVQDAPFQGDNCDDNDPLTFSAADEWTGFCGDRVDDNCHVDDPAEPCAENPSSHNLCNTGDEPCPSTQPTSGPPEWNCVGEPPANVIAHGYYASAENPNVTELCTFVYESEGAPGEHYVAYTLVDGPQPFGEPSPPVEPAADCNADRAARRHLFFSDLSAGACEGVTYVHAYPNENPSGELYPVDDQKLSNRCRKMMKNVAFGSAGFSPDIQYFAASREEALAKLAVLDTAEVACVGIDNLSGEPYRPTERWYVQASVPLQIVE